MGNVVGERVQGNLVYVDHGAHRRRWIDAIGPEVTKYITRFVGDPVGAAGEYDLQWTVTRVEAGVGGESEFKPAVTQEAGGAGIILTDNADNDGINAQLINESFKLASGKPLYFGVKLKISDATQSDFFVGLAITDTDILGGVTDRIGFEKLDGVTDVKAMVEKDSVETLTAALLTLDAAYHIYEFFFDGANVEFFVDGVSKATPAVTNLPDDEELRVSLHVLTGEAVAKTATFAWLRCIQIGY